MKQIVVMAAVAVGVGACSSLSSEVYADPVYVPKGHTGYAVHCEGTDHNMGDCRNLAQKVCQGPYNIQAQANRLMIIDCGSAATAAPAK